MQRRATILVGLRRKLVLLAELARENGEISPSNSRKSMDLLDQVARAANEQNADASVIEHERYANKGGGGGGGGDTDFGRIRRIIQEELHTELQTQLAMTVAKVRSELKSEMSRTMAPVLSQLRLPQRAASPPKNASSRVQPTRSASLAEIAAVGSTADTGMAHHQTYGAPMGADEDARVDGDHAARAAARGRIALHRSPSRRVSNRRYESEGMATGVLTGEESLFAFDCTELQASSRRTNETTPAPGNRVRRSRWPSSRSPHE